MKSISYITTIELSDEAYELMLCIDKDKFIEYRGRREPANEIYELIKYNLVESIEEAWHDTYKLSDFGKEILLKFDRDIKINNIIE